MNTSNYRTPKATPNTGPIGAAGAKGPLFFAMLALVCLNALLSFENQWPTPFVKLDSRLAPEVTYLWMAVLAWLAWRKSFSQQAMNALAAAFLVMVIGRYVDVTIPALFGRNINLFWDAPQLPRWIKTSTSSSSIYLVIGMLIATIAAFLGLFLLIRKCLSLVTKVLAPASLNKPVVWVLSLVAVACSVANLAGWRASWPYISKPVIPTYWRQTQILVAGLQPGRLDRSLPASPSFSGNLARLNRADIKLFMLESYGAVVFDDPLAFEALKARREALAKSITVSGRKVLTGRFRSPTFAGGSELAHMSLLSGIDLSDPLRHELLLNSDRPTLIKFLKQKGYQTFGLYSSLNWFWPEKDFYQFDIFLDGPSLQYPGPRFGYWGIPDQYAVARLEAMHPLQSNSPPRFTFFPTISTHLPFSPTPPLQPDWNKLKTNQPYEPSLSEAAVKETPDWLRLFPRYLSTMNYCYQWLASYLERPGHREELLILVGDHQPASSVSGRARQESSPSAAQVGENDLSWDVPVHIISNNEALLATFQALGFTAGLELQKNSLGGLHQLTSQLLEAFSGSAPSH